MTKTNYYNAITAEQTRTNSRSLISGIKGPIEFILRSQSDPEQTIHYWSTDNWTTTNEFVDKQQQGHHVFITLRLKDANYKSGTINIQAYSVRKGLQKSAITTHNFNILGYNSIGIKPENETTIPFYIEYLANWFDVNPKNNYQLYPPVGSDPNNPFADFQLTTYDQELLANYITWLKDYAYTGPTSSNRDKLTIYGIASNTTKDQANTFIYGTTSINPVLTGAPLDQMIKSTPNGWLPSALTYSEDAPATGGIELRVTDTFDYAKVDFRMNGNDVEYKTIGIYRVKKVIFALNLTAEEVVTVSNQMTTYGGFSITNINTASGNTGSIELTCTPLSTGEASVGTWTKLVTLATLSTTEYIYVKYVFTVIGMINSVESVYQIENPRYTDVIWKRYIMTSAYAGEWVPINAELQANPDAIDNYIMSKLGVLGFNYKIAYQYVTEDSDWNFYYGVAPPENVNIISSTAYISIPYIDVKIGIVGYVLPNTELYIGTSNASNGLRGIRINKYQSSYPQITRNPLTGERSINYYGEGYSPTNPNTNLPQGFNNSLISIPGIQYARDLIGWTIRRVLQKIDTREYIIVIHKICDIFHDDLNDINNFYLSFATVTQTQYYDSNYQSNIINIINQSAGFFLSDDILSANGLIAIESVLVCPRSYTVSTPGSNDVLQKPFNYHPDTKSVIINQGFFSQNNFYDATSQNGINMVKVPVITHEYIENPANTTLLNDGTRRSVI